MEFRVTDSNGVDFKKHGIHNGARGKLKAWQLSDKDDEFLKDTSPNEMVLKELPKVLFLEMKTPMKEEYPGLPENWFPMTPVTKYWCLDSDENIEICRRGFPLVPDFSITIDSVTGQTLESALPDLGDEFCTPSQHNAMRGYISLSRVTAAHSLLIAQPFNPLLFRSGSQAFPTLLFNVLMGEVTLDTLKMECQAAAAASQQILQLKAESWKCCHCKEKLQWNRYIGTSEEQDRDPRWQIKYSKYIIRRGCLRKCVSCCVETGDELAEDQKRQEATAECDDCHMMKEKDKYAESMWHHRRKPARQTRCLMCCEKSEPPTRKCDECHMMKKKDEYSESMWRHQAHDDHRTRCLMCCEKAEAPRWKCDCCHMMKKEEEYTESMWHNRTNDDQRTLCLTCCRPKCVAAHCRTCPQCRDPRCKKRKCQEPITALNSKSLPENSKALLTYLCDKCRYITCKTENKDGGMCGKVMPKKQQQRLAESNRKIYICGDCLTLAENRATLAKNRR
jgi:hypothetical protein